MRGRLSTFACAATVLMLLSAPAALAHSKSATSPADGAVGAAPEAIVLSFDKPMRVTVLRLISSNGDVAVERKAGMEPVTRFEAVPKTPLAAGSYTVEWRGLAADGHPMEGTFGFEVSP